MQKFVVVRVGDTGVPRQVVSTPDSLGTQFVHNYFMEGSEVIVLFLGTGDLPLSMTKIARVRSRVEGDDFNPDCTSFMTFNEVDVVNVQTADCSIFSKLLADIKFKSGRQIVPGNTNAIDIAVSFYKGVLFTKRQGVPVNTTVRINPQ